MMRRQGFFGAAMLPMSELEYTGIIEILSAPGSRFRIRFDSEARAAACRCASRSREAPM